MTASEKIKLQFESLLTEGQQILRNCGWDGRVWAKWPAINDYLRIRTQVLNLIKTACGEGSDYYQELHRMAEEKGSARDPFRLIEVLGVLEAAFRDFQAGLLSIETSKDTPVTQTREFSFVKDTELRKLIERDYIEIQRAYVASCWKSVIILSGGAIEAILLDLLQQNQSAAMAAPKTPKKPDITKWDLADLINVCVELKLVDQSVEKLSHPVREYRNLVHPGNEIRNKLVFGTEEAKIALEVLHIVHRGLSP